LRRNLQRHITIQPKHAAHALHTLIAEGKLTAKDITNALKRREKLIFVLRHRLAALESGAILTTKNAGKNVARGTRRRLTAARRAALKLQGQYLGTVRPLSKAAKAKIKAIREKKGFRAAIAEAKRLAK
jgi:hypothetical protein